MRVNLPVTNIEYPINDDTLIVSTTDTKGRITYINPTFIEVSGFSEDEAPKRNRIFTFKHRKQNVEWKQ